VRYFLTGATGFVGGALARLLTTEGHQVRAVVRQPDRAAELARLGVELFPGDVTDKQSLRKPMTGMDGVFHVAGLYKLGLRDPSAAVAVNVDGTRHVLELMQELGVPRGVYTSTLAVNSDTKGVLVDESYRFTGRHLSTYDETKARAHAMAESFIAAGLPLTIVQPGLVYGPGDTSGVRTMLRSFLRQEFQILPARTAFCWAHVDDIARGHLLAMTRGAVGRNYFLAGPPHTFADAMQVAAMATGLPAPRWFAPPAALRATAAVVSVVERIVPVPPGYASESLREVAGTTYIGSNDRARRELGWIPRPLEEGWAETVRHEAATIER
jgi:nucleoside-diphosphate-sugar epimerase